MIASDATSSAVDGNWVKNQLDKSGRTQADLARFLNLDPPIINKIVKGRRLIKAQEADRIRKFFAEDGSQSNRIEPIPSPALVDADLTIPLRSEMPRDIPILGTVSGGAGALQMNGEAIDWACRPPRLRGRGDIFGLYVEDTSMIPAYRPGWLIFVERARPPKIGDDVVIEIRATTPREEDRALIKHLLALTPTIVRLEQYNPHKEIEIPRKAVIHLYRVMTLADLLGR